MKVHKTVHFAGALALAASACAEAEHDLDDAGGELEPVARTVFIAEYTDFASCNNADVNDVTGSLEIRLSQDAWNVLRLKNQETLIWDWAEASIFPLGIDNLMADNNTVAIYAGHGGPNRIQYGDPSPNAGCLLEFQNQNIPIPDSQLGTLAGDRSNLAIFVTSFTGRYGQLELSFGGFGTAQVLAYDNSPVVDDDSLRVFYMATRNDPSIVSGMSTSQSWLTFMQGKPGLGQNSPVVLSWGADSVEVNDIHINSAWGTGALLDTVVPEPGSPRIWFKHGIL